MHKKVRKSFYVIYKYNAVHEHKKAKWIKIKFKYTIYEHLFKNTHNNIYLYYMVFIIMPNLKKFFLNFVTIFFLHNVKKKLYIKLKIFLLIFYRAYLHFEIYGKILLVLRWGQIGVILINNKLYLYLFILRCITKLYFLELMISRNIL